MLQAPESRIRRLESRAEIDQLIARYGFAVDDRDTDALAACFTADAVVRSLDGVMDSRGREAIMEMYRGRFAALGPTFHFTHDRLVEFDDADPGAATGLVAAHAEVMRNGVAMLAAIRYQDRYRFDGGRWRIAERVLSFLYYTPVAQYAATLASERRQRAYGDERPADWPEKLPTWIAHHRGGSGS